MRVESSWDGGSTRESGRSKNSVWVEVGQVFKEGRERGFYLGWALIARPKGVRNPLSFGTSSSELGEQIRSYASL